MGSSRRRVHAQFVDVVWRPNALTYARLAVVVPRFHHTAVARNRVRRRLRELVRRGRLATLPAVDLIVRARRAAYGAGFTALQADLTTALARVG